MLSDATLSALATSMSSPTRAGPDWPARFSSAPASRARSPRRSDGRPSASTTSKAIFSRPSSPPIRPTFPFVALLVSGGHTQLLHVTDVGRYALLGDTIDDAAGEAFDKSAKLLGLGYPGGPALARLAEFGDPEAYALPRPLLQRDSLDFSFAGLKTAVRTHAARLDSTCEQARADLAASTQAAIVDVLAHKSMAALARPAAIGSSSPAASARMRRCARACAGMREARPGFTSRSWRSAPTTAR